MTFDFRKLQDWKFIVSVERDSVETDRRHEARKGNQSKGEGCNYTAAAILFGLHLDLQVTACSYTVISKKNAGAGL